MRKIAIVGAGEIGTFLAERFSAEGIDVTVIDRDPEVLSALQNRLDVAGSVGSATSIHDLQSASVEDADLFIATTRQDETNLIACLLATELHIPHKIAVTRYLGLRGQRRKLESHKLGIDLMVNASEAVNHEIMDNVETTGASEVARFADGRIILVGYQIGERSELAARTVREIVTAAGETRFNVAAVVRGQELLTPQDNLVFQQGDYLYILSTQERLPELNTVLNVETIKTRSAVIYGDNFLSQILAGALLNRHFHVTVVAARPEKAQLFRHAFKGRADLHVESGDGTEVKLLRRVKVPATSVFIAANTDDATNLTACMVAKALGVGKTIATIRRTDILPLCRKAGVDVNVAPRLATARVIQRLVHENRVLNYRAVSQTNLEVVELAVQKDSRALRAPLKELRLPRRTVIGAVVVNDVATLPTPDTRLSDGDRVILLTHPEQLTELESYFAG